MRIYTYCSYRSSHYGYQYCSFTSNSSETKYSLLASENNVINNEFIKWCENYNGWQLALRKFSSKSKYLLMVGQLEKSRELEKKEQKWRGDLISDENSLDSDYYMTIGFLGHAEEIKRLAVFLLGEYKKDGYRELFNKLEKTIEKTDDSARYIIKTEQFNAIFTNIPETSRSSNSNPNISQNNIFGKIIRKVASSSDIYLSCEKAQSKQEPLSVRKKKIEKCIEILSNFDNLSGNVPLLIAYNYFSIAAKIDIRIDYEYLWFY